MRRMIERRVEGLAILSFEKRNLVGRGYSEAETCPLSCSTKESPEPLLKTVRIDHMHGVRQVVQHLAALGHVRIALDRRAGTFENRRDEKNSISEMHEGNRFGNTSATARGGRQHG